MRKFIQFIAVAFLALGLSACRLSQSGAAGSPSGAEPTLSEAQVQTQISTVLTVQPGTPAATAETLTDTPALPTVEKIIAMATSTATPEAATATPAEQAAATATAEQTQAGVNPSPTPVQTLAPTSGPAGTASPSDPRTKLGNPSGTDPMDNSTFWNWPTGTNDFTSIDFSSGHMTLTSLKNITGWRIANPTGSAFGDLYLEATVKTGTCAQNDQYGIIAHVPDLTDANQGIVFGFTCDGHYSLKLWNGTVGTNGQMTHLVEWTASKAILAGSGQTNRIGLMMSGSRLLMYANGTLLGEVSSSVYPSGFFGLFVGGLQTSGFNIQVDSMSYWLNPKP